MRSVAMRQQWREDVITVNKLAGDLGLHKSSLMRTMKKMGIEPSFIITEAHGQKEAAFTAEQEMALRKRYSHRSGSQTVSGKDGVVA